MRIKLVENLPSLQPIEAPGFHFHVLALSGFFGKIEEMVDFGK